MFRGFSGILSKYVYLRSSTCDESVGPELCTCAQSHALGSRTGFRLGVLAMGVISGVVYFREIVLGALEALERRPPGDARKSH